MSPRFGSFSNPFDRLLALQRELDRSFDNPLGIDLGLGGRGVFPSVNVFQDQEGYLITVEVPGVPPEKVKVETNGQTLTISGEREKPNVEGASHHRRERESGRFSRSFTLPSTLDAQATYKHGVLSIRVPLKAAAKPRQIEVQAA